MRSFTREDLIRISLKRKWWILLSIALCVPLAYGVWKKFPKTYMSTIIVTIDSPKVAKDYVKGLGGQEVKWGEDPVAAAIQQVTLGLTNKSVLLPVLESLSPYPEMVNATPESLMNRLRKSITIARPKEGVGIVISYQHADPYVAQAVATLLVGKLQEDNVKRREGLIETTTEFLSAELNRIKEELEAKEQAISDFKKAHIGELPGHMEANLRTLDRLQTDLTISSESLNKAGERLTALEKGIGEFTDLGAIDEALVERSGRTSDTKAPDPRVARLEELRQKLNGLLGIYKENYPDVVHLREEIRRLESEPQWVDSDQSDVSKPVGGRVVNDDRVVRRTSDRFLKELLKERDAVKIEMVFLKEKQTNTIRQIKEIDGHVQRTPAVEQRLAILVRDYDNLQKGYQSLLDKRTNARIVENYENRQFGEQYRVIEPANLPHSEQPPTLLHFLLGGFALGCVMGMGGAIGVELLKPGFHRPDEVEDHLGLLVIASIPPFKTGISRMGSTRSRAPRTDLASNDHLIARWEPHSIIAEQYRVASTRLLLMTAEKRNVVTLVASSIMGEGKTTTAVNLAYILGHDLKKNTLLIDCDFKRPMVHEYMGMSVEPGLSEAKEGRKLLKDCIHPYDSSLLSILPCGNLNVRPTSIAGIQYLKEILPELKTCYDHVILDGPPVLTLADVNILSSLADQTILVVQAGVTSQEVVRKAAKQLRVDSDCIGVVLTQMEIEFAPYLRYEKYYATRNS
jgi:polysaccharide biosynthesis transport protein